MKKTGLLNIELSEVIASMGHGDVLVIGDAGLPVPRGVRRIDLALSRGVPEVSQVLQAVLSEMQVESAVVAHECVDADGRLPAWCENHRAALPEALQRVSHEEFKQLSQRAVAVVRTGEFTPYANIALIAGVVF